MRALTLWEPYATAIAVGIKTIETRSWAPPANVIGERIAIHAARQSFSSRGLVGDLVRSDLSQHAKMMLAFAISDLTGQPGGIDDGASYPLGHVVATAVVFEVIPTWRVENDARHGPNRAVFTTITDGHPTDRRYLIGPDEHALGDYGPGRWAWILDDVRAVRPPIAARGHQRLWDWWQAPAGVSDPDDVGEARYDQPTVTEGATP